MNINIKYHDFTPAPELINYVDKKVNRLSRFHHQILASEIHLVADNSESNENKVCEIELVIPGNNLFVSSRANTFEEATNKTVDSLQEQIRKRKTWV